MSALAEHYLAYMKGWTGRRRNLTTPCCDKTIEVPAPSDPAETWDSLCTCIHCGSTFMKVVTYDEARGMVLPEDCR